METDKIRVVSYKEHSMLCDGKDFYHSLYTEQKFGVPKYMFGLYNDEVSVMKSKHHHTGVFVFDGSLTPVYNLFKPMWLAKERHTQYHISGPVKIHFVIMKRNNIYTYHAVSYDIYKVREFDINEFVKTWLLCGLDMANAVYSI